MCLLLEELLLPHSLGSALAREELPHLLAEPLDCLVDLLLEEDSLALLVEDLVDGAHDVVGLDVFCENVGAMADHANVVADALHLLPLLADERPLVEPYDVHLAPLDLLVGAALLGELDPLDGL